MIKLLSVLSFLFVSSISFAQTPANHQYNPANKSQIFTSRYPIQPVKSMLYLDKLVFENEKQFKKEISIAKMNQLIGQYTTALRNFTQSTNAHDIKLEIIYKKDSQIFNLTLKNKSQDLELYKQALQALEKIERPQVNTTLKLVITGHTVPIK